MKPLANKLLVIALALLTASTGVMAARPAVAPPAETPAPAPAPPVTSEQVAAAIAKGIASVRAGVRPLDNVNANNYSLIGAQILSLLSLVNAGVNPADPMIAKYLPIIANSENEHVYVVSLKCQLLAVTDPKTYNLNLTMAAQWLMAAQLENGMWSYTGAVGGRMGGGDNSNTQFALLGLHEAAKAGVPIKPEVWARSQKHFENSQCVDGGWAYMYYPQRAGRGFETGAYGSMTAAGTASLIICGQRLNVGGQKAFVNGVYPSCGSYKQNRAIAAGIDWLAKKFSVTENPGRGGGGAYQLYYLYALERVGMISGVQVLGTHDWYREGAAELVARQHADGSWGQNGAFIGSSDTAFGLLFLAKGNRPVLFQKLRWTGEKGSGEWNRNLHDLENLCAFIGTKLGKAVTWQTASLDQPLEELRMSPVLLITGHEFPKFTAAQMDKLKQFVETGGTVLCDACCGSPAFRQGFRAFAKEAFPDYPCRPLDAEHPIFHSFYEIGQTYGLEGIDLGCRTGVIFSPNALSCLLEMQDYEDAAGKWSLNAMKLCTNIGAYATGKEMLADRLAKVELPAERKTGAEDALVVERGAVRLARLVHEGDYNADPKALSELAALMRQKARVDVVSQAPHVRATDADLGKFPVVFMIGHYNFKLTPEEIKGLRAYLDRGGFLLAEACCGKATFDASFREMVKQIYPDQALKDLGEDHPIYRGAVGVPLGELRYRKILAEELKTAGTRRPPLEAVTVNGRTTILYSRYDYSCALEGDKPYSCRGYIDEDGQRLALDLVLYAIGY